ncbi:MAG: nuclear transport factor 2 family protein [Pedobacter sp.]|jgi:hypothetical protein
MKTLKTITAALLIVLSTSAFAKDDTKIEKLNINYALKAYIDAVAHGKIDGLNDVMDKDVKFTSTRGQQIINHDKDQMLKSLKHLQNVEQNCSTEFSIIESTPTQSVVKVTMKYDGFSKINYLSMSNTGKGWKIISVATSFI